MDGTSDPDANPECAAELDPQSARVANKLVEQVLHFVGDAIDEIVSKRNCADYEFSLREVDPTKVVAIAGGVTCVAAEPRGTPRIAIGTTHGEICLLDTKTHEVIAQKQALDHGEPVQCVALCSDGVYAPRPPHPTHEGPPQFRRPRAKIFAVGRQTPNILVFDVCRSAFGAQLQPACTIGIPEPEDESDPQNPENANPTPIAEQLHVKGASDGIWVVVLMFDRTIRAYMCPLGDPEEEKDKASGENSVDGSKFASRPIFEEEEELQDEEKENHDFANKPKLKTPMYVISLVRMALTETLPEPPLDHVRLSVYSQLLETRPIAAGTSAGQVPLICMASSPDSGDLVCYSMPAPPSTAAPAGMDIEALLKELMPAWGVLKEPAESKVLKPRRTWNFPGTVTATAASPDGLFFAVGGSSGSVLLIETALGPSFRSCFSGHYSAVSAVAFHRADVLLTAGTDSWIHHYNVRDGTIAARYMCASPPDPSPVVDLVVAQLIPIALTLDGTGTLRLLDLKRHSKIARPTCRSEPIDSFACTQKIAVPGQESGASDGIAADAGVSNDEAVCEDAEATLFPHVVVASSSSFCVICEYREVEKNQEVTAQASVSVEEPETEETAANEEPVGTTAAAVEPRSRLAFFEFAKTLRTLYPAMPSGAAVGGVALVEAFKDVSTTTKKEAKGGANSLEGLTLTVPTTNADVTRKHKAQPLAQPQSNPASPQSNTVAKLTAENLKRIGRDAIAASSGGVPSTMSSGGMANATTPAENLLPKSFGRKTKNTGAGVNWQVAVRRSLRASVAQKEVRLRRVAQRMGQLAREINDAH